MSNKIRTSYLFVIVSLFFLSLFRIPEGRAMDTHTIPRVIPALKEWKSGEGTLKLSRRGVITYTESDKSKLHKTALILSEDIKSLTGYSYEVIEEVGESQPQGSGNVIILKYAPLEGSKKVEEGYTLEVGNNVEISGSEKGVFWGTRTLLQMLYLERGTLPRGTAVDWPDFESRGFMLDVARKFFTMDYLIGMTKVLSFYKMNEFQIHLNDNGFKQFFDNDWDKTYAAFRLQSETYPGLTAKDGSYSKEAFREFQIRAREYGVMVIPEIDVPAHALSMVHYKPDLGTKTYGMDHLDLYNPDTYTFVDNLLKEYIAGDNPVFVGEEVHIGTDEYNAKESEKYRSFTDRYLRYVQNLGKRPRMWGGLRWLKGETPVVADGVTMNAWSYDWVDPVASLKVGYKLINSCDAYLYIVPAAGYYRDLLDHKWLYNNWSPWIMNSRETLPRGTEGVLGAMFAVWNDKCGNGISEQDVYYRTLPAVRVLSQKMWQDSDPSHSYEDFEHLAEKLPEAPGVNLLGRLEMPRMALLNNSLRLDGKESIRTEVAEVGYPYTVTFDLCPDEKTNNSGILFRGPHSTLYVNWENTGKIAFARDGYTFVFDDYRLPNKKWTNITIEGDYLGTTLLINGERVQRLEGREKRVIRGDNGKKDGMKYQETLIFPLSEIGDKHNGFSGSIANLKVSQGKAYSDLKK